MSEGIRDVASIELTMVLVAVTDDNPRVLTIQNGRLLPSGPLESRHRTLQLGLRSWVSRQTNHALGYMEQLYTFADRDRAPGGGRVISISYLGLTREAQGATAAGTGWRNWYRYLPWEDRRGTYPSLLKEVILPRLRVWVDAASDSQTSLERAQRIDVTFGVGDRDWNEELVLQRYELLYEAGVVPEACRNAPVSDPVPGEPMMFDHRRILATGMARLRAKIKYRPVVFEVMPPSFTLLQLQRTVEALAGRHLHKQNFRRLIDQQGLVEETGKVSTGTGGRPAKLFRFRRDVLLERAHVGTKLPLSPPTRRG